MATKTAFSMPFQKYTGEIRIQNLLETVFNCTSGFTVPENKRLIYRLSFNPFVVQTIGQGLYANISSAAYFYIAIQGSDGQNMLINGNSFLPNGGVALSAIPQNNTTNFITNIAIAKSGSIISANFKITSYVNAGSANMSVLFGQNSTSFFHINGFLEDDI